MKALYQWQLVDDEYAELITQYSGLAEYKRIDRAYFEDVLQYVLQDEAALDRLIEQVAARSVHQIDTVAHGILLLALAELKYRNDVPEKVILNEAVNLAKRFGAIDSYRFVNAVTDKAAKQLREAGAPTIAET